MGPPSKKWMFLALAAISVGAVGVCFIGKDENAPTFTGLTDWQKDKRQETLEDTGKPHGPPSPLPFKMEEGVAELGEPSAKVQVIAFIPAAGSGGCGNETASVLNEVHRANQERLYVKVVDFESPGGQALQAEFGIHCAGLLVNKQQRMTVDDGEGGQVTLNFGTNLGDSYTKDELYLALDSAFTAAYGEPCTRPKDALKEESSGGTADASPADKVDEGETGEAESTSDGEGESA